MGAEEARGPRRVRLEPERISDVEALIIGAAGLVGSHVRAAFADRRVAATFRHTPAPDAVRLDVTDETAVQALIRRLRPRVVVLAAAEAHVERCEREPAPTRRVNVEGTRTVVQAAREVGATIVVFSSEYVFDGRSGPYGEDDPRSPINEYGRQKVEVEDIARSAEHHVICRSSGVFGWEPAGKNFVCQLVRRLRAGKPFSVPADQVITPTYAPDLARAVVQLLDRRRSGTFHVVGPRPLPRDEFARSVVTAFALPPALLRPTPTEKLDLVAPRPRSAGLRDDKLRAALGHGLSDPEIALRDMASREVKTS